VGTLLHAGLLLVILVVLAKHVNRKRTKYRVRRGAQTRVTPAHVMARVSIVLGYMICGLGYLWTIWLEAAFASGLWGSTGIFICLVLAPVAIVALPFYAGFGFGDWLPMIIGLGSIIVGLVAEMIHDDLNWTEG
jgi:hypothetical protein